MHAHPDGDPREHAALEGGLDDAEHPEARIGTHQPQGVAQRTHHPTALGARLHHRRVVGTSARGGRDVVPIVLVPAQHQGEREGGEGDGCAERANGTQLQ